MSNEISKQEYLKRYLEDTKDSVRKRKKKPKTNANIPRLKIIDQDIDLKCIDFGNKSDEEDDDEAPVIAEVIDDRPPEMRELESSRWKKIENVSYVNSSELRKASSYKIKDLGVSSQKSDPARSAPCSPPLVNKSVQNSKRTRYDSDSDSSPPRIQKEKISRKRHDSGSDISPPRVQKGKLSLKRHDSGSDISPPRSLKQSRNKRSSDSDISPPRRINQNSSSRYDSDSDMSPPRHKDNSRPGASRKGTHSKNSETDEAFSRHSNHFPGNLRTKPNQSRESKVQKSKRSSDSDISPPRSKSSMEALQGEKKKPKKTLSGLKAGLQSSETLRRETQDLRKREKFHLNMLDDSVSGRNADTIIRDKRTGLKRDLDQEQQIKDEENKKNEKNEQKYREWGKGIEQTQMKNNKFIDDLYEMSKPLARYRDDEDLEEQLKSIIHDDDPMSEYIKKKRKKDVPSFPVYSGPPAPPNRFGILPGYRWDGVDRSNGFEKRYFEKINSSKAVQEEAYLWSVQNM